MKLKKILSLVLAGVLTLLMAGCVNQHPEETGSTSTANGSGEVRLVATSPAVAQICNRLGLDLVGICESSSDLPERYDGVTTVGMAMNPDLEIIKSLDPDYILSPSTLQNDLQPKYASIGVSSLFLNLKSVEGMYGRKKRLSCWRNSIPLWPNLQKKTPVRNPPRCWCSWAFPVPTLSQPTTAMWAAW